MMPSRNRAALRVRAPASPRAYEIILTAEDRRRFADFIILLPFERRIRNAPQDDLLNAAQK